MEGAGGKLSLSLLAVSCDGKTVLKGAGRWQYVSLMDSETSIFISSGFSKFYLRLSPPAEPRARWKLSGLCLLPNRN